MNRPKLIRDFYSELREVAGGLASSAELLEAASELADAFVSAEQGRERVMHFRTGGVPFDSWSVDRAFAAGPRILRYERELVDAVYEDEADPFSEEFAVGQWMMENAA